MNIEQEVLTEIEKNMENDIELYSYLYNLVYGGRVTNITFLEGLYSNFLKDKRSSIRQISIYALLFGLQIQNDIYKQKAIEFIRDPESSFDLRSFSLSGLSQAYMGTYDLELLKIFYDLFIDEEEDEDIRGASFTGMMRFIGLSSVDILRMNCNIIIIGFDDIQLDEFVEQIEKIEGIITVK